MIPFMCVFFIKDIYMSTHLYLYVKVLEEQVRNVHCGHL